VVNQNRVVALLHGEPSEARIRLKFRRDAALITL
jgi:hypothetical protein